MTDTKGPEQAAAIEATEKMVAAYTQDVFTAEQRGYQRGKADAEKRMLDLLMLRSDIPPIYTEKVRGIIFGGGENHIPEAKQLVVQVGEKHWRIK